MSYQPEPLDTSRVELSREILQLTEKLAEHTHNVWARLRLSQGWTYGPTRDDAARKHPCLVPYAELSEEEKEADRHTALETIKAILALGYVIQPPRTS